MLAGRVILVLSVASNRSRSDARLTGDVRGSGGRKMIRTGKTFVYAVGAASLLCLSATATRAAVITTSASAPATAAISQPDFSAAAFNGAQDFTDNAGPPGQTFTATAATPTLAAFTLKGFANTVASFGGNVNTGTWTITPSRVDAGNVLTRL